MTLTIKKIVVRNIGVLKAFDTPNAPQLAKLTTFYARNGRGKTTLSAVLRSASLDKPALLKGRRTLGSTDGEPEVTLVLENGNVRFADGKWSQRSASIEVFDAAFIADNLYAGETADLEHDRSLFAVILGETGVKLAKQQEFFNAQAKRAAAKLKAAEAALQDDVPRDQTRDEFFAYTAPANLDSQIDDAQKALKVLQQADRLSKLKKPERLELPVLAANIKRILASTVESIQTSARDELAAHFEKFHLGRQGEGWVKFGLDHITDDTCPFCGKDGVDDNGLVTIYGQIFGDAYRQHFDAIRAASDGIEDQLGFEARSRFEKTAATNAETIREWAEFYSLDDTPLANISMAIEGLSAAHNVLKRIFDAKRDAPLAVAPHDEQFAAAEADLAQALAELNAYNVSIDAIEAAISARRSQPAQTEVQALTRLHNLLKRKRRTDAGVISRIQASVSAKRADTRAKNVRSLVQTRLKAASDSAAEHYYTRVNHYLDKFDASFRISKFSNSMTGNIGSIDYGLVVRGHPVARGRGRGTDEEPSFKNTLSTGDKTTLAFAFFLAGLDRDAGLVGKVVVFDDPLSSHDSHRKARTVEFLSDICRRCAQIIVLSHDAFFLREVSKRCPNCDQSVYEIKYDGADNWSKAVAADLDVLCQSDYALQLKILTDFYNERVGEPTHVAPAVRKVLETHYRRSYSAYFLPTDNLGPIIHKIREHGPSHPCWLAVDTLEACNTATMGEHHGDDPSIVSSKPVDADNLRGTVRDCLELIHAQLPQTPELRTVAAAS